MRVSLLALVSVFCVLVNTGLASAQDSDQYKPLFYLGGLIGAEGLIGMEEDTPFNSQAFMYGATLKAFPWERFGIGGTYTTGTHEEDDDFEGTAESDISTYTLDLMYVIKNKRDSKGYIVGFVGEAKEEATVELNGFEAEGEAEVGTFGGGFGLLLADNSDGAGVGAGFEIRYYAFDGSENADGMLTLTFSLGLAF